MLSHFPRNAMALPFFPRSCAAWAQTMRTGRAALPEVTVTGNPLGASDLIAPTTQCRATGCCCARNPRWAKRSTACRRHQQLLRPQRQPAGHPRAGRRPHPHPAERRRGARRSALSYDHAVPVDALVTERIEVLRGPSALLYGGSAVGGVVNVIDNRIPSEPIDGFGGRADLG